MKLMKHSAETLNQLVLARRVGVRSFCTLHAHQFILKISNAAFSLEGKLFL